MRRHHTLAVGRAVVRNYWTPANENFFFAADRHPDLTMLVSKPLKVIS